MTVSPARALDDRARFAVLALAFAASMFDGYDLIVLGSAVPALLAHPTWGLTAAAVGVLASYALVGMFVGALLAGPLTDRIGRRPMFLAAVAWFSVMTVLVALAPTPGLFGLFRFLSGMGFGAVTPICVALVVEVAPAGRRNLWNAIVICGFPAGGVLAALLAIVLLEPLGFQGMFALGGVALVTVLPAAWRYLPESPTFRARTTENWGSRMRRLLHPDLLRGVVLLSLASVAAYLLAYGMNTWLPQFMRQAGYDLGPALAFLLVFNAGSIAGSLAGSALADRHGGRGATAFGFVLGAVVTALLAVPLPAALLYVLVGLSGAASIGTITVLLGFVANRFPDAQRATAIGLCSGIGRLGSIGGPVLGGALASAGVGLGWSFGAFALAAVVGALATALVRGEPRLVPGTAAVMA